MRCNRCGAVGVLTETCAFAECVIARLTRERDEAQHWRERHCRNAEAYSHRLIAAARERDKALADLERVTRERDKALADLERVTREHVRRLP